MKKVDVYNEDYTKLNNAYIAMYDTCQRLSECEDADLEVLGLLRQILFALDPALDKIKSEMTVKTRFKDEISAPEKNVRTEINENGAKIFHPKFD